MDAGYSRVPDNKAMVPTEDTGKDRKKDYPDIDPTTADSQQRIEFILECWATGYKTSHAVKLLMAKFGIQKSMAYEYVKEAEHELMASLKTNRGKVLAESLHRMDVLIRKAYAQNDLKTALWASMHRDKVSGLLGNNGIMQGVIDADADPDVPKEKPRVVILPSNGREI